LQIEVYFRQIREAIEACPVVQSSSMTYDKRGTQEGLIQRNRRISATAIARGAADLRVADVLLLKRLVHLQGRQAEAFLANQAVHGIQAAQDLLAGVTETAHHEPSVRQRGDADGLSRALH